MEGRSVERVYENRGIRIRMWLAMIATGAMALAGLWMLLVVYPRTVRDAAEPGDPLFLGSVMLVIAVLGVIRFGHYGLKSVVTLDADERTRAARLGLWRPLGEEIIETHLDDIVEWRYEVGRKRTRMPIRRLRARLRQPHRWLLFELKFREPHPVFREMAPEAVHEFEKDIGIAPAS